MFGSPKVQMTYNARLRRARVQFYAEECFKSRKPPYELVKKLQERFEEEKEEGHIETYALFTKRFEELWAHIRSLKDEIDPKREIKLTIGQGGRIYEEVQITPASEPNGPPKLSCRFSERRMLTIPFNIFVFNIIHKLQQVKSDIRPDRAQLRFIYLLLKHGHAIADLHLAGQPTDEENAERSFSVRFDPISRYVSLHIFDSRWLETPETCRRLLKNAIEEFEKKNDKKMKMVLLNGHSLQKLSSLGSKMQAFSFNMPYDLLLGYDASYRLDAGRLRDEELLSKHEKEADLPRWKMRLGARPRSDYFQVAIQDAGMSAKIQSVVKGSLEKVRDRIDLDWVARELEKQRIVYGHEKFLEPIWQAIQQGRPLVGMKVAEGTEAKPGTETQLHLNYKEDKGQQQTDMRSSQNRRMVRKGERVAEVRYVDGIPGKTVEGVVVHALAPIAASGIDSGEGVIAKLDNCFYAERDGLITLQGNILLCETSYVHKGNINMASGNLAFDGSVVIEGDIEAGASVEVKGHLVVKGMVSSAKVKCSGDLDVKGGIVTGAAGFVHVGGKMRCGFIENSTVIVKDNLAVERSILHSTVIAGGAVVVLDSTNGLIAGGMVSSWSAIHTARFGLGQGKRTECRIGSDYMAELRLQHLQQRIIKIEAYKESLIKGMHLLEHSPAAHAAEQLQALQKRSQRVISILQRLTQRLEGQAPKAGWNQLATLVVTGILDKNVTIMAAGRRVPVKENLKGVMVPATSFHGEAIVDMDEMSNFAAANPGAIIPAMKNAS